MGSIRGETPHLLKRLLQTLQQMIENARHLAEFVAGVFDLQAIVQIAGRDTFRASRHLLQRPQAASRDHLTGGAGNQKRDRNCDQKQQSGTESCAREAEPGCIRGGSPS